MAMFYSYGQVFIVVKMDVVDGRMVDGIISRMCVWLEGPIFLMVCHQVTFSS